jgi:hypothetical protein
MIDEVSFNMQANESLYVTCVYLDYLDRFATVEKLAPNSM